MNRQERRKQAKLARKGLAVIQGGVPSTPKPADTPLQRFVDALDVWVARYRGAHGGVDTREFAIGLLRESAGIAAGSGINRLDFMQTAGGAWDLAVGDKLVTPPPGPIDAG